MTDSARINPAAGARLRRGIVTSAVNNSSAFGFSILITAAFGMLSSFAGKPSAAEIALFALGAVLPFSLLEAIATRGFRRKLARQGAEVVLLGTAANLLSVAIALAVTYLAGRLLPSDPGWLLAPLLASSVYVLVEAVELAVAERIQGAVFGEAEAEGERQE